jgi:putative sugar O-methyltransferase
MTADIVTFKSSRTNYMISMHDPKDNGLLYYHGLLYVMAESMDDGMFQKLKNIKSRGVGAPRAIYYRNEVVCLDYVRAVYELDFMESHINYNDTLDILEIGAGYGRTCHAILSNWRLIRSYTIADLDNCLALSHKYLEEVLSEEQFSKIRFVPVERESLNCDFDLCICVDVFAEIEPEQARQYIGYINEHCKMFYLQTPLSGYTVNMLNVPKFQVEQIRLNKDFEEINIIDENEIKGQVVKFRALYLPGPGWKCLSHSNAKPYMHYWQAMYQKQ